MPEPYTAVGLIPTVWGIRSRADIQKNLDHIAHLIKVASWLSSLDLPVRLIAIPEDEWVEFHDLTPGELADVLVHLARSVSLPKLRKHPRGPKKPKPEKQSGAKIKHVATAKILKARQTCTR